MNKKRHRDVMEQTRAFYDTHWGQAGNEDIKYITGNPAMQDYENRCRRFPERLLNGCKALLEIGCGSRPISIKGAKPFAVDVSLQGLKRAREKHPGLLAVVGRIETLPFKEGAFDGVLATNLLYHIQKEKQKTACREMERVTRKTGIILTNYLQGKFSWKSGKSPVYIYVFPLKALRSFFRERRVECYTAKLLPRRLAIKAKNNRVWRTALSLLSGLQEWFPRATLPLAPYVWVRVIRRK